MKRVATSIVLGLVAMCGLARAEEKPADPTLFVGDPAPRLSVGQWVQGEPVKSLDKGTIYVIEFWATWCGPCVQSIPHVSRLQERYKDKGVVFVGVDCAEPDGATKVPPFVRRMGKRMNYRVAVDDYAGDENGRTYAAWMKASDRGGIPCAFVVGRDGKIAWIGHPMSMADPLAEIMASTFEPVKEFGGREAQRLLSRADNAKDPAEANRIWDEAAKLPDPPPRIDVYRIALLAQAKEKDTAAAYRVLDQAVAAPGARMTNVLRPIEMVLEEWVGTPDADRVLSIIDRAAALPGDADDRAYLTAVRFKAYDMKHDYAAASRTAGELADAPGTRAGRLADVAWAMALRKDPDPAYLDAARRLIDRAEGMEKSPEVATDVRRARLGLALRMNDRDAVTTAVRQLTESPDATPDGLQDVAEYVLEQLGDGPAEADAALALLDRAAAMAEDLAARESVARARFKALAAKKDYPAAYAQAGEVLGWPDASAGVLNEIAWQIATDEKIQKRDLDLAERAAARAVALEEKNGNYFDTYARVMYEKGDLARAVELQSRAVKEWDRPNFKATLEQYKAKLAAATPTPAR